MNEQLLSTIAERMRAEAAAAEPKLILQVAVATDDAGLNVSGFLAASDDPHQVGQAIGRAIQQLQTMYLELVASLPAQCVPELQAGYLDGITYRARRKQVVERDIHESEAGSD